MSVKIEQYNGTGYLAAEGYRGHLETELSRTAPNSPDVHTYGDLILGSMPYVDAHWVRVIMKAPFILTFDSIGEAARELSAIQRNWALYPFTCFRRAQLIQDKLPYVNPKPREFPSAIPRTSMGLWTLTDEHTIIASAETTSFLPRGELLLREDHENPPSRAYLKLQEALLRCGVMPAAGERCLDAGACPGGWTWVLTSLNARVTAIDRSELSDDLMKNPLVTFVKHDAFTLAPEELGPCDWVFSDVICYPARLLEWVRRWIDSGLTRRMICTIKMQGEPDWDVLEAFAAIPHSKIVHLRYNKHELTWIYML